MAKLRIMPARLMHEATPIAEIVPVKSARLLGPHLAGRRVRGGQER